MTKIVKYVEQNPEEEKTPQEKTDWSAYSIMSLNSVTKYSEAQLKGMPVLKYQSRFDRV